MKLASIEEIKEILPHPDADKLEIAQILGWQCVVKKSEFKAGDKVVFVVIDTILPSDAPWAEFLKDSKNPEKPIRLKTIKLRGQYSQGLVLPLSVLSPAVQSWHLGADVGGELGIKKYEKEIPTQLAGIALGGFPSHVVATTDEENGLSNPDLVQEVLSHQELTITMKLDGSSCTIIVRNGGIWQVCSRRLSLKETEENGFWKAARKLKLPEGWTGAIQGELMGPGVQGNQLKLKEPTLYVFQVRQNDRFLSYEEMETLAINELGTPTVPLLGHKVSSEIGDLKLLQELADSQVLSKNLFPHLEELAPAEGIVVRSKTYKASGNGRPLGFKIINRNYKD
jgi:RNA ligase (TIGR02306 family)